MSFLVNERDIKARILQGDIGIFVTHTSQHITKLSSYWKILSLKEQEYAQKFHFYNFFARYIIAHGILRRLLSIFTSLNSSEIPFHYNQYQKPYIYNSQIQFNLSYSSDFIAYALAKDSQVGIDIEIKNASMEIDNMVGSTLSTRELAHYLALKPEERMDYFYGIWTKKEALVKAIGCGLTYYSFKEIDLNHNTQMEGDCFLEKKNCTPSDSSTKTWYISSLSFNQQLYGAIATELPNKPYFFMSCTEIG